MALTTTADMKTMYPSVADFSDAQINSAILRATARIAGFIGFHPESAERTEYYDVTASMPHVVLKAAPVISVASVTDDAQAGSPTVLATDEYFTDDALGVLYPDGISFTAGNAALKVVYTAGFADLAGDDDADMLDGLQLCALWILDTTPGSQGIKRETADGRTVEYTLGTDGLPADVENAWRRVRRKARFR